jgi:integrase
MCKPHYVSTLPPTALRSGPAPCPVPSSVVDPLEAEVVSWIRSSQPANTTRSYNTYKRQFHNWCVSNGRREFPASPVTVAAFLKYLLQARGLAASTITKSAASAIADDYKFAGITSPTRDPLVKAAKVAVRRLAKPEKPKLPLTPPMVLEIARLASRSPSALEVRDVFMIVLMMTGMLRESEAVALRYGMTEAERDVWIEHVQAEDGSIEEVMYVYVEKSKTDQFRRGHTIVIGKSRNGMVCPISWFKRWVAVRRATAPFLFHHHNSTHGLATSTPCSRFKYWLGLIGVDAAMYGSHSARRGGATAAAEAGVEERLIRRHGNWRSDCVYRYIAESLARRLSVSAAIFGRV